MMMIVHRENFEQMKDEICEVWPELIRYFFLLQFHLYQVYLKEELS